MYKQLVGQYLQRPYARVIMPDEAGRYAAQILEFPGCFSEGGTPDEAYENLQEAAESWLESALSRRMAIPEPFATQGYSGTVSLRLPKSIHRRAAQYAHKDGVSLNQFLVAAIAARVGAEDLLGVIASDLDNRLDRLGRAYSGASMHLRVDLTARFLTPAVTLPALTIGAMEIEGSASSPQEQGRLTAGTTPTIEYFPRYGDFAERTTRGRGY